jgi:hypothetical protein
MWFARHFVPPLRVLLHHYSGADDEAALGRLLIELRRDVAAQEPAPLRELVVLLRPRILAAAGYPPSAPAGGGVELAVFEEALAPLTVIERQVVWLETMAYGAAASARLMRMSEETAAAVREKAGGLLRTRLDDWSITLLRDCGAALGEEVRSKPPEETVHVRDYINSLDGRVTWQRRAEIDRQLAASWFEIDHFCRVREVDEAVSRTAPLSEEQAAPYFAALGVEPEKPGLWKRLMRARA